MEYISQDQSGIPDKQLYKSIAKHFKGGIFTPRKIDRKKAQTLTELSLREDTITNLNFLRFFPNLKELSVESSNLTDISGLQYTPRLDWLTIYNHALTDISALRFCPELKTLQIEKQINSRTQSAAIWNIDEISNCRYLTGLSICDNNIEDISWITELVNLQELYISKNPINDFLPLKELTHLKMVEISSDQNINPEDFQNVSIECDEIISYK